MYTLNVMSFNIRGDFDSGTEAWSSRKQNAANIIIAENPDLIGFQEVMNHQYEDLVSLLPDYNHVGVGRDDGAALGERAAIFFKKERFTQLETSSFWLSETPDKPSFGWDAACIRICTYVKLADKISGRDFYHFNTHLDHMGKTAMVEGAKLVRDTVLDKGAPAIITGDFNVVENAPAYSVMTEPGLCDAKYSAADSMSYGTFHGFNPPNERLSKASPIDYIFYTQEDFNSLRYKVLVNGNVGEYSSDHYPITAGLGFKI